VAEDAVTELLTVIFSMSSLGQVKVAHLSVFADQAVLVACAGTAAQRGLQPALESFAHRMDRGAQRTLAQGR
jgi:hypothetical protein